MNLPIQTRLDFLKALMIEDRNEIRGIRASIYSVTTLLGTATFAITSFLLGHSIPHAVAVCASTDALMVVFLWVFFLRLRADLYHGRQCLVARQELIKGLASVSESDDFNPFPDARAQKVDVTDSELWWLPVLTTCIVAIKAVMVWVLFRS